VVGVQKIGAFFRLIRYPNLIFIALTQCLFYFFIVIPTYKDANHDLPRLGYYNFSLLLIASLVIAAAGYIINDYFDMDIDNVNKPDKLVIGKWINRRWAMLFHMLLSFFGLFLTALVAMQINNLLLLAFNFLSVVLLLFYSTTFKKKLLIGNVIISLLTAWVVGVLFVAELNFADVLYMRQHQVVLEKLYKYTAVYAGFAFMVSLVREVIKDLEDIIGDRRYGCTTMPIVWGVNPSKIYAGIWIVVLMGLLLSIFFYSILNEWFWLKSLLSIFLLNFLIVILINVKKAATSKDYASISKQIKLLMLMGILSILLFI
jgi:4-hydroxybenzoate polyprenyltransferase